MKTVLLYEPASSGHRLAYVRYILTGLAERPVRTILCTGANSVESEEFGVQLASLTPTVATIGRKADRSAASPLVEASRRLRWMLACIRRFRPDHVFVPYADGLSQLFGISRAICRRSIPSHTALEAIVMRGSFAYDLEGLGRRAAAQFSIRAHRLAPWTRMHFIDELAYDAYVRRWGSEVGAVSLLPDPVDPAPLDDRDAARRRLGVPLDGTYIATLGDLSERKGVLVLLRAFATATGPTGARLLLVGRQSPQVSAMLKTEPYARLLQGGRIIQRQGYVSNAVFADTLVAADVICAPYRQHVGSASLVVHAAVASRFVIGSNCGWIGETVRKHELGVTCDVSPEGVARAIADTLPRAAAYKPTAAARRFAGAHSVPCFVSALLRHLDDRLAEDCEAERTPMRRAAT